MITPNFQSRDAIAQVGLGIRVDRGTANLTNGLDLFTVIGGRVLVMLVLGEVTTLMETKTINLKLQANPTAGTTNDMSADVDMSAAEVGTLITIAGTAATATQLGKSGVVRAQDAAMVVAAGAIEASIGDTHTGSIKWSLWYLPLDTGAYVVVA